MSILDEDNLINDKTLEFYETILYKLENYYQHTALSKRLFYNNKDILRKYLPEVIKICENNIIIDNKPNRTIYDVNSVILTELCGFIPRLFLFDLSYIPLLDEKEIEYINNINFLDVDIYKVIRRHNTKQVIQIMKDNNELKEFNPNIIINNVEKLTIPNIDIIDHIGDKYNKFFIKRIKNLSFNLVNSNLYENSKNSISRVCNKYNDLFGYSEIEELEISLNDLYWRGGKQLIIFDKGLGLDEYSFNIFSNFKQLRANHINIYISRYFIYNQTSIGDAGLDKYISSMVESIMRKNNEFKSLNITLQ